MTRETSVRRHAVSASPQTWQAAVLRHLRSGLARTEAIRLAGTTRAAFYAHLRRSTEFREQVMAAETAALRESGLRARKPLPRVPADSAFEGHAMPGAAWIVVAIGPLLLGMALLALGVPAGQQLLRW